MKRDENVILKYFGIKTLDELIGRKLRVEFCHCPPNDESANYIVIFHIPTITLSGGELSFPRIRCVQDTREIQVSFFFGWTEKDSVEFHITFVSLQLPKKQRRRPTNRDEGYFYSNPNKQFMSQWNMSSGKITLI